MALIPQAAATAPRYEFGFDSPAFSDKLLRLEVVAALAVSRKRPRMHEEAGTSADRPRTLSKKQELYQRREEESSEEQRNESVDKTEGKGSDSVIEIDNPTLVKQKSIKAMQDVDDDGATDSSSHEREEIEKQKSVVDYTSLQEEEEGKTEHARKDLENGSKDDEETNRCGESAPGTPILRVKQIWVCSLILASESPFFRKLFTNGMKESDQKTISLRVNEDELEAVEELIAFIYKEKFSNLDHKNLLKTLIAADKFEVPRAVSACGELMLKSEMTPDAALMYMEFSCSNSAALEALAPVISAAGHFLVNKFKEIPKYEQDLLKMPLSAIRYIFSSSELVVPFEDYIYSFLLKWANVQYPNVNERGAVFSSVLVGLIRFMHLSLGALRQLGCCALMADKSQAMLITINALLYKSNSSHRPISQWNYEQRVYLIRPVKVITLDLYPEAVAYMELSLQDCFRMTTAGNNNSINSEVFMFSGHKLFMRAVTRLDPVSKSPTSLGLFLGVHQFTHPSVNVDIAFSVRMKPAAEFVTKVKFNTTFTGGSLVGHEDVFSCPWPQLTGEGSPYLIGGMLHMRVEVRIKQP